MACSTSFVSALWGCLGLFQVAPWQGMKEEVQAAQAGKARAKGQPQHWQTRSPAWWRTQGLATPPP